MKTQRFAYRRKGKKSKVDLHYKYYMMDTLCKKTGIKKGNKLTLRRISNVIEESNKPKIGSRVNYLIKSDYLRKSPYNKRESYYVLGETGKKILKKHGSFVNYLNYKLEKQKKEIITKEIITKEISIEKKSLHQEDITKIT